MAIDLDGLRKAAGGDQSKKVMVSKKWLAAVADEIERLRKISQSSDRIDNMIDRLMKGTRR